jgi:transcriptional regulator with XRE-family HTH domain
MKERLIQLLDMEQLSPSKFADLIGVQRSSISHIISGRNKPSFDFLQKTLTAFPGLNASWLLMGEGTMYEQMGRKVSGTLFDTPKDEEVLSEGHISEAVGPAAGISAAEETDSALPEQPSPAESPVNKEEKDEEALEASLDDREIQEKKRIVQVMILYEDDTFKTFMPAH